jgi:hypothetical protein
VDRAYVARVCASTPQLRALDLSCDRWARLEGLTAEALAAFSTQTNMEILDLSYAIYHMHMELVQHPPA